MTMFKRLGGAALLLALVAAPLPAVAHTTLRQSNIAEGSRIAENPRTFTMTFGADSGLASVQLTNAAGQVVPLNYAPPRTMARSFTVPLPALPPGGYALSWRLMGADGHTMNGGVKFTVTGVAATPAAPVVGSQKGGEMDHTSMPGMSASERAAMGEMLTSSVPANGAVLAQAPRSLALTFMHPVMLQTVAITNAQGAPVRATFRRPAAATKNYAIALPSLTAGVYTARWSATGGGHTMQGSLTFTVR